MKKLLGLLAVAPMAIAACGGATEADTTSWSDAEVKEFQTEFANYDGSTYVQGLAELKNTEDNFFATDAFKNEEAAYITGILDRDVTDSAPTAAGELSLMTVQGWFGDEQGYFISKVDAEDATNFVWEVVKKSAFLHATTAVDSNSATFTEAYNAFITATPNNADKVEGVAIETHSFTSEFGYADKIMSIKAGFQMTNVGDYFWTVATVQNEYLSYSNTYKATGFTLIDYMGTSTTEIMLSGSKYGLTAPESKHIADYALDTDMVGETYLVKLWKDTPYSSAATTPTLSLYEKDGTYEGDYGWMANSVDGSEELIKISA